MDLRVTPAVGTGFDARLAYDTLYRNLISSSLAASLQRPIGMLTLTWYQSRNPRTGERFSSQLRTLVGFRKAGFPLAATVNLAYDIQNSTLQDQRYRVEYQGSCWNVSAEYRDTKLGLYPTKEILILFGLKGVGALPEIKGSIGSY
jgi:lipopolysaccharide assembly outer membrane protein LptD (OstA)